MKNVARSWVGGWYCDKCHGMVSSPPPEVRILNIKCKPGADVLTCIAAAVKIAKATDQTIFLEIGSYSIAASKSSCELDLYKIYQKEVEG